MFALPRGKKLSLGVVAWMLALPLVVAAQDRLPDRRAPVVNATVGGEGNSGVRQNMLEMLQQLEQLQSEVRQLRDTVEVQSHELGQLKSRQRDLISDIDRRVLELERRTTSAPVTLAPPAALSSSQSLTAPVIPAANPIIQKPATTTQQKEYEAGFELMKQGMYERAIGAFRTFISKYPDSSLADNAQYWIAEGNYVLRNYKLALEEFNKALSLYPNSTKASDSMLKIGYVYYELGTYDKARQALNETLSRYPNTTVAKLASTRLDKMNKEGK